MLLHPETLYLTGAPRERWGSAQPLRHVVIDRFLDETFCGQWMREFPSFDPSLGQASPHCSTIRNTWAVARTENLNGQGIRTSISITTNRNWHRRLNLIVWLNARWEESWRGCLELIREPWPARAARKLLQR